MARKRRRKRRHERPVCPYCGSNTKCVDSSVIYGRSYGPSWVCERFPECDAYCGCHPGTTTPLGRLANKELREARKRAHAAFDTLWIEDEMSRTGAYKMLAEILDIEQSKCHIGMFDAETCRRVVQVMEKLRRKTA